jgi:hypothetical protein
MRTPTSICSSPSESRTGQGRSLDETIAAKPTAAFDAKWGQFVITPAFSPDWFTRASDALRIVTQRRRLRPFARKDGRL